MYGIDRRVGILCLGLFLLQYQIQGVIHRLQMIEVHKKLVHCCANASYSMHDFKDVQCQKSVIVNAKATILEGPY
jgi:hypothetical protein